MLNYTWMNCQFWTTYAPLVDISKGGRVSISDLDVSNWCNGQTNQAYLFYLRGNNHSYGGCNFQCKNLRMEIKSSKGGVLYTEWPMGIVSFQNLDTTSQLFAYTFDYLAHIVLGNNNGPEISFNGGFLAGKVMVEYGSENRRYMPRIQFENIAWKQLSYPSEAVEYVRTGGHNNSAEPAVQFVNCRNDNLTDSTIATGAAVWDATVGFKGQLVQTLQERWLSVRRQNGTPMGAEVIYFGLPVGALITRFRTLAPPGDTLQISNVTFNLITLEATPTTIATVSSPGGANAGFDLTVPVNPPYLCNTSTKATLTVSCTNVSSRITNGLILVGGFW